MADANLFPDEAAFTPRPAWQVIEAARRLYLTGELTIRTTPPTKIYMSDGHVYFAERSTDGTLPIRLMMEGVITREQMQRAMVIVNGIEHVGRMFDADPTIDRASVELCAELFTDDVMIDAANTMIDGYEMALYRRHPSGIDRWYPHSVPVTGRHSEPEASRSIPTRAAEVASPAKPAVKRAKGESTGEVKASARPEVSTEMNAEMTSNSEPQVSAEAPPEPQPRNKLNAPPITQAVPVTARVGSTPVPPPPITQTLPVIPPITTTIPVTQMPPPTAQIPVTAPPTSNEVNASAIADEVAEAIKRAFAGMGTGQ